MKRLIKILLVIMMILSVGVHVSYNNEIHAGYCEKDPEKTIPPQECDN